jgi:ppGpp synthetase/RelA/SpoT-type nucleotidyltranferase
MTKTEAHDKVRTIVNTFWAQNQERLGDRQREELDDMIVNLQGLIEEIDVESAPHA